MAVRERWAAREATLKRWLKPAGGTFRYGDPLVEVQLDGVSRTLTYTPSDGSDPECGIYWHLVDENNEVGPWGHLLEYTDWPDSGRGPTNQGRRPATVRYHRRERYPRVFLNYRRDDAEVYAGRVHETLVRAFGADEVFMDQFSLRPGEHFAWTIQQAVWHADVMVSLIGPRWHSAATPEGRSRLTFDYDYVRREIVCALDRRVRIVPIILPGGGYPGEYSLPEEMRGLGDLQALQLSPRHWDADMKVVMDAIRDGLSPVAENPGYLAGVERPQ